MSFDLAVWNSTQDLDDDAAATIYEALCEGNDPAEIDGIGPAPGVASFLAELSKQHPDLDSLPDDEVDDSPWSVGFEHSDAHVLMCMRWSVSDDILDLISSLAATHGLTLFDPQDGTVYPPPKSDGGQEV